MTAPSSKNTPRRNWLERYLKIQISADRRIAEALRAAAIDAERELLRLADVQGVGAAVRRSQLLTARRAIGRILSELFGKIKFEIENGQAQAVNAAIDAALQDDDKILKLLFPNAKERSEYILSQRQTAERNVQSLIMRMTNTERTLSRRVYHTKSLADGTIGRIINSSLARGDSAAALAKSVKDSILPSTPGGVGYAAKRLARTEINNAYHAQSINQNEDKPWVEHINWNLSKSHSSDPADRCEIYARQKQFPKERVPEKPHPNCFCYITPVVMDYSQFQKNLLAGAYNGWINENVNG